MAVPRQAASRRRGARHRDRSSVVAASLAAVLLAGCSGDDGDGGGTAGTGADVGDGSGTDALIEPDVAEPDAGTSDGDGDEDAGSPEDRAGDEDASVDDASDGEASDDDAPDGESDDGPGDDDGAARGARDEVDTSHLADLTSAVPGTWPVGDAGTVTFDLQGRDLVLRDIEGRAGWSIAVEEDERDEIEVDFRRGDERWRFLVERSGRHLEVQIEQRVRGASVGGYDLGDAGTFAFDVVDGRSVLTSLEVADGWSVREEDVDDEHIELDLRADGRQVEVEVELDGRSVDLRIVYQVRDRIR